MNFAVFVKDSPEEKPVLKPFESVKDFRKFMLQLFVEVCDNDKLENKLIVKPIYGKGGKRKTVSFDTQFNIAKLEYEKQILKNKSNGTILSINVSPVTLNS